jgi:hypothetical protein
MAWYEMGIRMRNYVERSPQEAIIVQLFRKRIVFYVTRNSLLCSPDPAVGAHPGLFHFRPPRSIKINFVITIRSMLRYIQHTASKQPQYVLQN